MRTILIVFLLLASTAQSQWKQVLSVPGKPVYTIYFLDLPGPPRIGFVGCGDEIWRTSDGGRNWTKVAGISRFVPSDFTFKDSSVGWVSSRRPTVNGTVLFQTLDGGLNWTEVTAANNIKSAEGIFFNTQNQLLFLGSWLSGLWVSNDFAQSWQNVTGTSNYSGSGFAFDQTGLNGVMLCYIPFSTTKKHFYTFDGGVTWSSITSRDESWQPLALGNSKFIAPFEEYGGGPKRTDDGGQTWYPLATRNIDAPIMGDIRGNSCRLYLQTFYQQSSDIAGMYRSFDEGQNWDFIGGPSLTTFDRRFWAKDRHVFAGDSLGDVYYLFDTVGTPFSARLTFDSPTLIFDTVNQCTEAKAILYFSNSLDCDSLGITNVSWIGQGSKFFQVETPSDKPRTVGPGVNDSIIISFPKTNVGTFTAFLKVRIKHEGYSQDTIITIKGVRTITPNASLSSYALNFDTIATCFGKELVTVVHNTGCDTEIVSLSNLPAGDFTVIAPTKDTVLYPGDSAVIRIQLLSTQTGKHSANALITVTPKNFSQISFTIVLDGFVERKVPPPLLYPGILNFDSLSVCDSVGKTLSLQLANRSGCDSLLIDSLWLEGDPLFTLLNGNRITIAPDSSRDILLDFQSGSKGLHNGKLHLRWSDGSTLYDSTILLSGFIYSGKGILSIKDTAFDFGTTTLCSERDTTILLRNSGCDTLWINTIGIQGSGFEVTDTSFFILPGDSQQIVLHTKFDTTAGQINNTGRLIVGSNSDGSVAPILLIRAISLPKSYSIRFGIDKTVGKNQDIIKMSVVADSLPTGLTTLDADLQIMNTDLLSYSSYQSPNLVSLAGKNLRITGNPIKVLNDTVAVLFFKVFLTRDSTTDIAFSNVRFNNGDPEHARCMATVLGEGNESFSYQFACSEELLSEYMRVGASIRISSVHPNPAVNELTIDVQSELEKEASLEIYDALGKLVRRSTIHVLPGMNSKTITITDIPSGAYSVKIERTETAFIILR